MEDDINGRRHEGAYEKQMTSACLASQFSTELGPAQPQLVYYISILLYYLFSRILIEITIYNYVR